MEGESEKEINFFTEKRLVDARKGGGEILAGTNQWRKKRRVTACFWGIDVYLRGKSKKDAGRERGGRKV